MWLAIDTATDRASVALGAAGAPGAAALEENLTGARRHAAQLLPMVEALLQRAGATLDDLTGIALSDGPGSFTGLRVGAAFAKALVRVRGLPLWVAPSLLVRAAGVVPNGGVSNGGSNGVVSNGGSSSSNSGVVVAVANALRGELFAAAYRFDAPAIVTELPPSVWRPEALVQSELRPELVVGELPPDMMAMLERWSGQPVVVPPDGAPHARCLIDLVGRKGGAVRVENAGSWEPVYGRPAEAQARWEMTHGSPLPNSAGGFR
jgi:tRNA threonylcarbamoyladenosine biosynthesis protein TsaB